uniref:Uncharacterized protein n=1 Tax=Timema bartmani TaxID=61472 RepID=A0A7R9EVP7_9NEOP|nr:unnamed protein product [Timema bartmani]
MSVRVSRWNMRKSRQRESQWNMRKSRQRELRWGGRVTIPATGTTVLNTLHYCLALSNGRKGRVPLAREKQWPPSKPIERGVFFGAEYSGHLVTYGSENMKCGAAKAVERVVGAVSASAEKRRQSRTVRHNIVLYEAVQSANTLQLLKAHGITMLPADDSTLVASAVESGQTVVLTVPQNGGTLITLTRESAMCMAVLTNNYVEVKRHVATEYGIPESSLITIRSVIERAAYNTPREQRITKELKLRPYRPLLVNVLNEDDLKRFVEFAQSWLVKLEENSELVCHMIWIDEA